MSSCPNMRAALEVMTLMLLCWPTTSEASVGGMAAGVEPSHQHSIAFHCCHMPDSSRRAIWKTGVWYGSADEAKVWNWIPPCGKNGTCWHSLMLAEYLRRPNSGCEHIEAAGGAFQQWWQWVTFAGAYCYGHGKQALVHHWWKCIGNDDDYVEK